MSERDSVSATRTLKAAHALTRRTLLKAVAAGSVAAIGPWYVRDAFSQSGQLNWYTWEDYAPKPLVEKFTKDTGIKLNVTIFSSNEEQLNKLRASRGEGLDLGSTCGPGVGRKGDGGAVHPD